MWVGIQPLDFSDGIADDIDHRDLFVHEAVHERRIGAVFQQAAYEIGQQILVLTDRCIHSDSRKIGDLPRRFCV